MSGLTGWVDFDRDLRTRREILAAMTGAMPRRGPADGTGFAARHALLGSVAWPAEGRRAAHGTGPATALGGRVAAVLAGALDNGPELRREIEAAGGDVQSGSDAGLALHAYQIWGGACPEHLGGEFALAVWDDRAEQLLLVRDRMGVTPLYYARPAAGLLFGSVPAAIGAHPEFEARFDPAALPVALQPRLALPGETPLAGVRELPPGHSALITRSGLSLRRYWRLVSRPHDEDFDTTARHVRDLLEDAVARRLPADGPVGAMLSGGVDSTSVAAVAAAALRKAGDGRRLDTFCVEFEGDGADFAPTELRPDVDAPYAAAAARFLDTNHHRITATATALLDAVPQTRAARGLPGWGQFDASMYLLFRQMREHGPHGLSGEAADEFFGGYPYLFKRELIERDGFPWLGDGPRLVSYLNPDLRTQLDPAADERSRYATLLADVPPLDGEDRFEARMREVLFLGMSGPLAVVLDRKERMSAHAGLDVRIPFCDHRLVEYAWNVPWSVKTRGGLKGLLKAAMADALPPGTLERRKSAYPHVQDPALEARVIREAVDAVTAPDSPVAGLFDVPRLRALLDDAGSGRLRAELPGGASAAQFLVQLVELRAWIDENRIAVG